MKGNYLRTLPFYARTFANLAGNFDFRSTIVSLSSVTTWYQRIRPVPNACSTLCLTSIFYNPHPPWSIFDDIVKILNSWFKLCDHTSKWLHSFSWPESPFSLFRIPSPISCSLGTWAVSKLISSSPIRCSFAVLFQPQYHASFSSICPKRFSRSLLGCLYHFVSWDFEN